MSASSDYLQALTGISQEKARAQAEAARQNGAVWGNTISNIGQMVAQYPEQQAKLKEIANRADLTNLEKQREQRLAATEQRQVTAQQQASQVLGQIQKTPDGLWDTNDLMQKLTPTGLDPQHIESLTTGFEKMNDMTLAQRKRQEEGNADLAHGLLGIYTKDEPITSDSLSFNAEALKGIGGLSDADAQAIHDMGTKVPPGTDLRPLLKSIEQKKKDYQPVYKAGAPGSTIYEERTGQPVSTLPPRPPNPEKVETVDAAGNPVTTFQTPVAGASYPRPPAAVGGGTDFDRYLATVAKEKGKTVADLTQAEILKAHEDLAKATSHGTAAGDIPVKVEKYDPATGRTTVTYMPRSQAVGQNFEKAPSATIQNRLQSARAVNQTGDDIIAAVKTPKVAAMLGPLAGRYNTVRDFLGDPPPELAELAGQINSFAIAQMGVHGMRNAQAAQKIEEMLGAKFTPESLIAKIKGINDFGTHLLQNEGMSTGSSGTTGLPAVGSTFQGGKVLKVTPVP